MQVEDCTPLLEMTSNKHNKFSIIQKQFNFFHQQIQYLLNKLCSFIILSLQQQFLVKYSFMAVPTYCQECGWFFDKMGACLPPGKLSIFSYISLLPYLIIFLFIGLTLWSRTSKQFRMLILLVSAYVVGDRLLKNLIQSPRPEGSCKKSFGMPSSHMTVITCYALELWLSTKKGQKIFLLMLVITQAISRVELNYHTYEQVFGGILFSIVYWLVFNEIWNKFAQTEFYRRINNFLQLRVIKGKKTQ